MAAETLTKKKGYHHGNLRQSLIDVAVQIISERERAEFTLRELARQLGVTHAATYHHFRDKEDLLAAVAEEGYKTLGQYIRNARDNAPRRPFLQLRAMAASYVRFAVENPAYFRVMYGRRYQDSSRFPNASRVAHETDQIMDEVLQQGQREGIYKSGDHAELATTAWATIHGLAVLCINGHVDLGQGDALQEACSRITRHVFLGIASEEARTLVGAGASMEEISERFKT